MVQQYQQLLVIQTLLYITRNRYSCCSSGYEDRAGFGDTSLANKAYVDQVAQGLDTKPSCRVGTTANLSATYSNGTVGVGATLTNSGTQVALTIDGITMVADDRVLVKDVNSMVKTVSML